MHFKEKYGLNLKGRRNTELGEVCRICKDFFAHGYMK